MKKLDIEARVKQLENLPQYKNKTKEELYDIAKKNVEKDEKSSFANGQLTNKAEKKRYQELFDKYIQEHHLETIGDVTLLNTRIYLQILSERIQNKINEGETKNLAPTTNDINNLLSINKQILEIDSSLGLANKQTEDTVKEWKNLKLRLNKLANERKGEFYFQCPCCGKMILLLRKVIDYNAFEWKIFKGTYLYNFKLMQLIEEKRITPEEVAEIWGVSVDYINLIYNNIYIKEKSINNSII